MGHAHPEALSTYRRFVIKYLMYGCGLNALRAMNLVDRLVSYMVAYWSTGVM